MHRFLSPADGGRTLSGLPVVDASLGRCRTPTRSRCARLTPDLLEDHLTFFRERAFADDPEWAGCYCFFPYHDPETTDFDSRTAEADREAITEAVETGYASGFLAYAGDQVVGWCNAAPRER